MTTSTLPSSEEITSWSNEKLLSVIASGDKLNWNIALGEESQTGIDDYLYELLYEQSRRGL